MSQPLSENERRRLRCYVEDHMALTPVGEWIERLLAERDALAKELRETADARDALQRLTAELAALDLDYADLKAEVARLRPEISKSNAPLTAEEADSLRLVMSAYKGHEYSPLWRLLDERDQLLARAETIQRLTAELAFSREASNRQIASVESMLDTAREKLRVTEIDLATLKAKAEAALAHDPSRSSGRVLGLNAFQKAASPQVVLDLIAEVERAITAIALEDAYWEVCRMHDMGGTAALDEIRRSRDRWAAAIAASRAARAEREGKEKP